MSSIRRALILWLMAGLAVIAALSTLATYLAVRHEIDELFDLQLKQLAYSTRIDDLLRGRQPGLRPRASAQDGGVTELVTQIWDRDGVLVYWSQPGLGLPVPATTGHTTVRSGQRDWRIYTLVQGTHALQVAQAQDERDVIATKAAIRTLLPFVVLIPLFGGVIWLAVGRGLRPLSAMSRAVAKRRPDALSPLAGSLNELLSRLDAALGAQRRFTADAAHELRTPLAALKLQLDVARRAGDNPARLAAYDDLDAGVARASHLVDQLLTLARIEPEALATRAIDVDLTPLAKEAIVARGALAAGKDVDLGLAREAGVRVHGDPASLAILLSNLLDNALRYTPRGGRIDVAIEAAATGGAVLTVADTGPGIPPEERERVFDRFFRSPGSHEPGSGLGLSIVKRIADAHHAQIELDAPEHGSGLVVRVRFPVTGDTAAS
jgi:two-component system OmpR family sensor kinase